MTFALMLDAVARAKYATPLTHDIDAIGTFDANAQAVPSNFDIIPEKGGPYAQAPTITLTSSGGPHVVTVECIVHGVDRRCLNVQVPIRITGNIQAGTNQIGFIGYDFLYISRITYLVKTNVGAGDVFNIGFDLSGTDVVVLADEIFASTSVATPLNKVTASVATEGRHKRWTGAGRPTNVAGQLVMCTVPAEAA